MRARILLVVFALACGRSSAPAAPPVAGGAPRPEEFCAAYARARCASDVRCRPASVDAGAEACAPKVAAECERDLVLLTPRTLSAIAGGRLEWRSAEAAACLRLLEGPCANREIQKPPRFGYPDVTVADPCRRGRLWVGKAAAGVACEHPLECAAGMCTACGRCPATAPAGSSCPGAPCAVGTTCLRQTRTCDAPPANCTLGDGDCAALCGEMFYWTGISDCVSPALLGGACEYSHFWSHTSESSTLATPCQPGLACKGGTCASPAAEGEPCARLRECAAGLTCLSSGHCGRLRGEGDSCAAPLRESDERIHVLDSSDPTGGLVWTGEGGDCGLGLACVDGACRRRPGAGEPCVAAPGDPVRSAPCFGVAGVLCDSGLCVVPSAASACASDRACVAGEWCACGSGAATAPCSGGAVGSCRPGEVRATGEPCEHDQQCASAACWQRHCAERILDVGAACTTDAACASGACGVETGQCLPACA